MEICLTKVMSVDLAAAVAMQGIMLLPLQDLIG